ncbi:MAG: putative two-component system response regulator [Herminiimonas sp.]|nr:putative two-component system response regulator [Herminiimonas sp.]
MSRVDELRPDVILLDLDVTGENLLEAISQLSRSRAKILLLTRVHDEALQDKAILAGAHDVLGKDTSAGMLLMAISKIHFAVPQFVAPERNAYPACRDAYGRA